MKILLGKTRFPFAYQGVCQPICPSAQTLVISHPALLRQEVRLDDDDCDRVGFALGHSHSLCNNTTERRCPYTTWLNERGGRGEGDRGRFLFAFATKGQNSQR